MGIDDALAAGRQGEQGIARSRAIELEAQEAADRLVAVLARDFLGRVAGKIEPLPVGEFRRGEYSSSRAWFTSRSTKPDRWVSLDVSGWEIADGITLLQDGRVIEATFEGRGRQGDPGYSRCLTVNRKTRAALFGDDTPNPYNGEMGLRPRSWIVAPRLDPWMDPAEYRSKLLEESDRMYSELFARVLTNGHHGYVIPKLRT